MMVDEQEEKVGVIKTVLCGLKSPLGYIAEVLVGNASVCWCCSFWRGVAWTLLVTLPLILYFAMN